MANLPSPLKKWLLEQPLLLPALSLVAAILSVDSSDNSALIPTLLAGLACTIFITIASFCPRKIFILTCITAIVGSTLHYSTLTDQQASIDLVSDLDSTPVTVYGIIDTSPRHLSSETTEVTFKIIHSPENDILKGETIIAYINQKCTVQLGQKIWLRGRLSPPRPASNPQIFDKRAFLHRQHISLTLQANDIATTNEIAYSHKLSAFADTSRLWIRKKLTSGIEDTNAAKIILAMFLGEKPANDSKIVTDFKNSGTIHVFAVSGLHVMMIGLIFTFILRICRTPLSVWIPSVIFIMFFYAIVTGMRPPAMRASIMGTIVLTAMLLKRKPTLPSCLWLSAIIALLWDTHSLFLPGFQLSYTVLTAIAFTGAWWMKRYEWMQTIDPFMPEVMLNKYQKFTLWLRKKSAASLAVSTSAWSGSSLLIWLYFGIITPLAIIASLPLMLIVFALLGTCCLSLITGAISPSLGEKVNQLNSYNASAAHYISHSFASIPHTRFQKQAWANDEKVIIYQLNDGGGSYLSLGGGLLLDAGDLSTFKSQVLPGLKKNGVKLDTLIASHSDINHIAGLTEALKNFPIKQALIPAGKSKSPAHREFINTANELGITVIHASKNNYPIAENISIEIIHSPQETLPLADDRCLTFMLHWHNKRILFLNDSGHYFSHWLRKRQHDPLLEKLTPDVLVIGKHARDNSIHPEIISMLRPKTLIATQAYYPAEQSRTNKWIHEVKNQGISLLLLNESGAVTITQDNDQLDFQTMLETSN